MKKIIVIAGFTLTLGINVLSSGEIHDAARRGNFKEIQKLIEKDPKQIDLENKNGSLALHLAVRKGHKKIAQVLIDMMAPEKISLQENGGNTALHIASFFGHTEIAQMLTDIMTPEQIAIKNKHDSTAFDFAIRKGHKEIAQMLVERTTPEKIALQNKYGETYLHKAARYNNKEIAQMLVSANSNLIYMVNKEGKAPTDIAQEQGHEDLAQLLDPSRMVKKSE